VVALLQIKNEIFPYLINNVRARAHLNSNSQEWRL
jgi:hypothetical protein